MLLILTSRYSSYSCHLVGTLSSGHALLLASLLLVCGLRGTDLYRDLSPAIEVRQRLSGTNGNLQFTRGQAQEV